MALDEAQLLQEMRSAMECGFVMAVDIDLQTALCVVAALQLALRHPRSDGTVAATITRVIEGMIQYVEAASYPVTAELMSMGNDPAYDIAPGDVGSRPQ